MIMIMFKLKINTYNYLENDMALKTTIDMALLKAMMLDKVLEFLQEESQSESFLNADQAQHMLDYIGSMLIVELLQNKEYNNETK